MKFVNAVESRPMSRETIESFMRVLNPLAPHLAEELWSRAGHRESIAVQPWPIANPDVLELALKQIEVPLQVQKRILTLFKVPPDITDDSLREMALRYVRETTQYEEPTKFIVVRDQKTGCPRIVNVAVAARKTPTLMITRLKPDVVLNIGVFCHLVQDGSIFLVRRAYRDRMWSLPGGAVEQGELLVDGLRREIAEETGYLVQNPSHVCTFYSSSNYSIAVCFYEEVRNRFLPLDANAEISCGDWFSIRDLPNELSSRQRNWIRVLGEYFLTKTSIGVQESDV
jgi:ADP-ribose pyrophosphatase YjhB (NUDIX family)